MAFGMPDEFLPMFVPVAVYWIASGIYHLVVSPMEQHRLFTEEEKAQNLATRRQVVAGVLIIQAMEMAVATLFFMATGRKGAAGGVAARSSSLLQVVGQLAVATLVVDFWAYFWHRWTHENRFLYKHVHARHHQLIVPYTYGSSYIHIVDALGGEVVGGLLPIVISGMSPRTAALFLTVLTLKGLDDHCGMWFPNNPIHRWMTNNSAFHALHHQHQGIKHNYSSHFLATWDILLGTYLPFSVEERKGGGYLLRTAKDQ